MIFLTVGSQLSFDRLTKSVDMWASKNPNIEVFAQIGMTDYIPEHMQSTATLNPIEYQSMIDKSNLIISHVGMGTIISALVNGKPLLVMPRLAENGEVRNNHQLSTIKFIKHYELIEVVNNENEVSEAISKMITNYKDGAYKTEQLNVSPELIEKIKNFINN